MYIEQSFLSCQLRLGKIAGEHSPQPSSRRVVCHSPQSNFRRVMGSEGDHFPPVTRSVLLLVNLSLLKIFSLFELLYIQSELLCDFESCFKDIFYPEQSLETNHIYVFVNQMTSVERVLAYTDLDEEGERTSIDPLSPTWPYAGSICFANLCLKYTDESPVILKNITLCIKSQEKVISFI